jgi:hypothetical protein
VTRLRGAAARRRDASTAVPDPNPQPPARARAVDPGDVYAVVGAAIALLVAWFAVVLPNVGTHVVPLAGGDLLFQFLPDYAYAAERLRAGALPLWNPWQGQPFLATLLPGAWYPARLLLVVLDVPTAMHVSTVAHLLLALVGTFALCRALGASRAGAVVGATAFTGIHALPALYWPPFLEGGVWLPVAALALVRVAATASWSWTLVLGAATGMIVLAGCYQHALYSVYGLAVLGLGLLADRERRGCLATGTGVARLAVAAMVAVATAAPQALPALAWSAETVRGRTALTDAQIDRFPFPQRVLHSMFAWPTDYVALYLSVPVALLAIVGGVTTGPLGAVVVVAAVTFGALMLGRGTDVFPLYRLLPGFAAFRVPERLVFLVAFLLAIASALGVTQLGRLRAVGRWLAALAVVVVAVALFAPPRLRSPLPWTAPARMVLGPPALLDPVVRLTGDGRTLLPSAMSDDGPTTKQATLHHVRGLEDYNPLSSWRLAAYLHAMVGMPPPRPDDPDLFLGWVPPSRAITAPVLLDVAGVRTLVVPSSLPMPLRVPPFVPVGAFGSWRALANPAALPRAYVVEQARVVPTQAAALAALTAPGLDPRREAVLVATPGLEPPAAPAGEPPALRAARVVVDEPEHVAVDVAAERPGVLVLTDAWAPGWSASVDGRDAPIAIANGLGRGVAVPAGARRVDFRYRAPGLAAGMALFVVGWGGVGVGAWLGRRRAAQLASRPSRSGNGSTPTG